jgi:hypothetical protein
LRVKVDFCGKALEPDRSMKWIDIESVIDVHLCIHCFSQERTLPFLPVLVFPVDTVHDQLLEFGRPIAGAVRLRFF